MSGAAGLAHRERARRIPSLALRFGVARRRGFTLVELLMVVLVLLLISAVSIPVIAPAIQGRHIREASRQVNSYFAVARDTALRNGRPVGVMIQRFESRDDAGALLGTQSEFSVVLSQVEVPQPYSGDFPHSRVALDGGQVVGIDDIGWMGLIRAGDQMQLNYRGRLYTILQGNLDDGNIVPLGDFLRVPTVEDPWILAAADGSMPPYLGTTRQPYSIIRQPVPTATQPLQLTGSVVIDLNWSGDDRGAWVEREFDDVDNPQVYRKPLDIADDVRPIVIMFAPDGSLERIYRSRYVPANGGDPAFWAWESWRPTGPIHILLGQRDAVPAVEQLGAEEQAANNWRNLDNLWVSIHPQTGLITTTEVGAVAEADEWNPWGGMRAARQFATRSQSMGGR